MIDWHWLTDKQTSHRHPWRLFVFFGLLFGVINPIVALLGNSDASAITIAVSALVGVATAAIGVWLSRVIWNAKSFQALFRHFIVCLIVTFAVLFTTIASAPVLGGGLFVFAIIAGWGVALSYGLRPRDSGISQSDER